MHAGYSELCYSSNDIVAEFVVPCADESSSSKQLKALIPGDELLDLVVIGCGPAGLSLAAETARQGLSVALIGPDLPFVNNYGVWEDEFAGKLPA